MRAVAWCAAVWLAATIFYWVGYVGTDDLFYARYAYLFHRAPMNWWEFRMPAILAMRASFKLFGPTEFAAVVPSLLASLAIAASVAWFLDWPRKRTWQSDASMLLVAVMPLDAAYRSLPSANQVAAGFLAVGTVCILKRTGRTAILGAALLALGFVAHEVSFFYIALFCTIAFLFDPRRYWKPVACCVGFAALAFAAECAIYYYWLGDPLARFKTAANTTVLLAAGVDPDNGISGLRFFLWPVQNIVLGKSFGFNLLALLCAAPFAWRSLTREQRILFATVFVVYLWLGYGSQVPWAYKPFYRQSQYYTSLTLGVAILTPAVVSLALRMRFAAQAVIGTALAVHMATLLATGGWGADVDVSRQLLAYAAERPQRQYLTDVNTLNEMYVLNGFHLPANVICVGDDDTMSRLLVNKEPKGTPMFRFSPRRIDGALVNMERPGLQGFERDFRKFLAAQAGTPQTIAPVRYRPLFRPLMAVVGAKPFMVLSRGGAVVESTPVNASAAFARPRSTALRAAAARDAARPAAGL